jgi:hypothetical protein
MLNRCENDHAVAERSRSLMSMMRVGASVLVLLCGGCVLHARQFLPDTGRYVSIREDDQDGGWRAESLVVTGQNGPLLVSVRVWTVDAGVPPRLDGPRELVESWALDTALRASIILVNPVSGALENVPTTTLLPEPVVVGARWRVKASDDSACFVEEELVEVTARTARVAHRFGCDDDVEAPFMNSDWQVGAGRVEFALADGGGRVRIVRVP